MTEHVVNSKVYFNVKEIRSRYAAYCRGCGSMKALIAKEKPHRLLLRNHSR